MRDKRAYRDFASSRVSLYDLTANTLFVLLMLLWPTTVRAEITAMDLRPSDRWDMVQLRSLPPRWDVQFPSAPAFFIEPILQGVQEPQWRSNLTKLLEVDPYIGTRQQSFSTMYGGMASNASYTFEDDSAKGWSFRMRGHEATLSPLGNDYELIWPECCSYWRQESLIPLGNFRADLRGNSILHQGEFRTDEDSKLPDIVPPPHHTEKTAAILVVGSVIGLGWYALGPESLTGTDKSDAVQGALDNIEDAFTKPPVLDKDDTVINYVGHPWFGMQFYLSQRNYNESPLYSFIFSAATSAVFEYFVEAFGEQPSIQDLIVTPVVGSVLGELSYQLTQKMRKGGFTTFEKVVVTIVNPLYVLQNGYR